MKLRIVKLAQRQIARMEDWWAENRPAAPRMLTEELDAAFREIHERPHAGVPWPTKRRPTLRRILLPKTENHVYFRLDEKAQTVVVLAVWGGPRGITPKL